MAVARQVQATGLQVKLKVTEIVREARASHAALCGGAVANDDVISYAPSLSAPCADVPPGDATSVRISGNGIAVTAQMLALTNCQRGILERKAISVTASEYRVSEGSEALVVFKNEREAAVALHEVGFARVREATKLLPDRFYKVATASNGSSSMAWARIERSVSQGPVYVHISIVAIA
jgi:hypothetical protein